MNYTKGPWKVDKDFMGDETYSDGDAIPVFPIGGGVCICEVVARNGMGVSNAKTQAEAEANARLISAAPDMYEALRNLVDCAGLTWLDGYKSELDAAMRAAHNALNKAEGRQNE